MKQRLLVEGKNDKYVYYQLCEAHNLPALKGFEHPPKNFVKDFEGIGKLLKTIKAVLLESDLERLGIMIDADTDIKGRWDSIRNQFLNSNIPEHPDTNGTIFQYKDKTIGIWLMPNNEATGALESFLKKCFLKAIN